MHGKKGLVSAWLLYALFIVTETGALEPVTALDDGFTIPSKSGMEEASLHYPGAESCIKGIFATAAWNRPFGIDDLSVTTFHAGTGFGKTGISVSYSGSGFDLYGDEQEKLGISYALFDGISCGFRVTRSALRIRGFGDASAWSADMGVIIRLVESVYIAGAFEDLAGAELGVSREPLDGRTRFSTAWAVPGDITLLASLTKVRRFDPSCTGGFTAEIFPSLTVGAAGATEPDRMEFLAAFHIRGMVFSYRGMYHRDLGMSHGFSLSSQFRK